MNKANILFLADTTHHTGAVQDHIQSITRGARINWHVVNPLISKVIDKIDLSLFDAIGVHYSIKPYDNYYLSAKLKKKIAAFNKFKFLFLQDEYQRVNLVQDYLAQLGFNLLFTLVNQKYIDKAYPDSKLEGLKKITVLTGYVTDEMKAYDCQPIAERPIDVSYRGRRYAYWLGSLAYEKQQIADQFISKTQGSQLKLDISLEEADRVYGDAWINLLKNSRAVLGTESGASIWDFDCSVERKTNQYLKQHKNANFNEVYEKVLKPYDGNVLYSAISPRIFEAAATKTPMIMFPGDYSGICVADRHYIPLNKDFSNIDLVLEKLKDNNYLQQLAQQTYEELIVSDHYSQYKFSQLIEDAIIDELCIASFVHQKDIQNALDENSKKYNKVNLARRWSTELSFMIKNFANILFDPKYTFRLRVLMLYKGLKRYISYLLPRFKA